MDRLFPPGRAKKGIAALSTRSNVYGSVNPIPSEDTVKLLKQHCRQVVSSEDVGGDKFCFDLSV